MECERTSQSESNNPHQFRVYGTAGTARREIQFRLRWLGHSTDRAHPEDPFYFLRGQQASIPRHSKTSGAQGARRSVSIALERQLQPKLELPWIEGGRWLPRTGPEHVHVGDVELVDQIKHVDRAFEFKSFSQVEEAADTQIGEDRRGLDARVALQVSDERAVQEASRLEESGRGISRCHWRVGTEVHCRIGRHSYWTIGIRAEVKVAVRSDQNVEWSS